MPVDIRRLRPPAPRLHARRGRRAGEQPPPGHVVAVLFHALLTRGVSLYELVRAERACAVAADINILLALFNLIPVPPLDGGNVLAGLLPREAAAAFDNVRPYGFIILYALMLTGVLSALICRRRTS